MGDADVVDEHGEARTPSGPRASEDAGDLVADEVDARELGAKTGFIPVFTEHEPGPDEAFREDVPEAVLDQPFDSGEAWAYGPDGQRMWGKHGAAGLLAVDRQRGVLMQHRAKWNHHGGTWGIPGGALASNETAIQGALREAHEETAIDPTALDPLFSRVVDLGFWRYTTVTAIVNRRVRVRANDAESAGVAWVQPRELRRLKLHPSFADSWPTLWDIARHRPALVLDVANILGARGDGWWRDPAGAATKLLERCAALASEGIDAGIFGLDAERSWPDVLAVLEGRGRSAALPRDDAGQPFRRLALAHASGSGDDEIVDQVARVVEGEPDRPVIVATSDRQLRNRLADLGVGTIGGGRMRGMLERANLESAFVNSATST